MLKGFWGDLKKNWFLIRICFSSAPLYCTCFVLNQIRGQIVIFLEFTIALQFVLNCAEYGRPFSDAALFLLGVLAFTVVGLLAESYMNNKIQHQSMPVIRKRLKEKLYARAKEIDLEAYDNPQFYNNYILAVNESDRQIDRIFTVVSDAAASITGALLSGVFFLAVDPTSFVFVAGSFGMMFGLEIMINRLNFKMRMTKNPIERKQGYISRVFYLSDYAKELRLNPHLAEHMQREYTQVNDELLAVDKRYAQKLFMLNWLRKYVCNGFIFNVLYILYLVYNAVVLRRIFYSSVVVMQSAARSLNGNLRWLSSLFPGIADISRYVDKIQTFLNTVPKIITIDHQPLPVGPVAVELDHVSFRYSAESPYALRNVCMTIRAGEKAAIVGYNGAGKSTLVKLIMRLYDPTEGEIRLNGINIQAFPIDEYRRAIGVIFQDFKLFAATVKENVLLDISEAYDDAPVTAALDKAGFAERLRTLSTGLETPLTTEFAEDGVNLSGGEAQKVAIARAFHKDAPLVILDEPSSALDPITEYHFNNAMRTAGNHTMIFISHRLSTTRVSDKIYMLEHGRVAEYGTHAELLALGGKYAEMWNTQTARYLKSAI